MNKKNLTPAPTKLHIRKGDSVVVISGNHKGAKGTVLKVYPKTQRAIVEGVAIVKRHIKATAQRPEGGIVEKEAPLYLCKLMVVDPKAAPDATKVGTRIGRRKNADGKLERYAKKSGQVISNS
ncbi:MAG: 50S ribosomal protein L24 [Cytophagales bacterium]|nr:MAG: 50S ribosomal protein L24 [Cytophagales bacterium]TAF62448.1 MAG: 50S ribosomal protein L24 [Cytophagales bacterium]